MFQDDNQVNRQRQVLEKHLKKTKKLLDEQIW